MLIDTLISLDIIFGVYKRAISYSVKSNDMALLYVKYGCLISYETQAALSYAFLMFAA